MSAALAKVALAVDVVAWGYREERLSVLLVRRGVEPWAGAWALPGGFVGAGEELDAAAARELAEETGLRGVPLTQLQTFGAVGRDPRGRVVTVVYTALVRPGLVQGGTDAAAAAWWPVESLLSPLGDARLPLAFDHAHILARAREDLRDRARRTPLGFELLPATFTLPELQALYEALLGEPLDPRNFRKKVLGMGFVVPAVGRRAGAAGRPAQTWAFDPERYAILSTTGFELRL